MKKIVLLRDFRQITREKKVLVGGCFDLLHYGHLTFLRNAKKVGDFLIVALESDQFIKNNKERDPIHNQDQRAEILAALDFVDSVIKLPLLKSNQEYFDLIKLIKPKVIAVTEGDPQLTNKEKQAKEIGAKVMIVTNLLKDFSSQKIIKAFE